MMTKDLTPQKYSDAPETKRISEAGSMVQVYSAEPEQVREMREMPYLNDYAMTDYFADLQLRYYEEPRQYNNLLCNSFKFPTKTEHRCFKQEGKGTVLSFQTRKKDHLDIKKLPYR